jgi:hypothetical protein
LGVGDFPRQFRGAVHAKPTFLIPADLKADPLSASGALFEMIFYFLDGRNEGLVVFLFPASGVNLFPYPACPADESSEDPSSDLKGIADRSRFAGLECALIAVLADVTKKFELESSIGRKVPVISHKFYQGQTYHLLVFSDDIPRRTSSKGQKSSVHPFGNPRSLTITAVKKGKNHLFLYPCSFLIGEEDLDGEGINQVILKGKYHPPVVSQKPGN